MKSRSISKRAKTRHSSAPAAEPRPAGDWFDEAAANRVVTFFERYLRHTKGQWAGKPFTLLAWQRDDIIRPLFGWKRADGTRKYRTAYIEVPKKNGKSTLSAGIALYLLFGDGERGAEVFSAAGDREQAAIVFDTAKAMVEASRALSNRSEVFRRSIVFGDSFYKVLSADAPTKHGFNAHAVIFDELHVQPNRNLWDTLTTGTAARLQSLVVAITTAGFDRESICYEQHEYARKILAGVISDPSYFAYIRAADEADDWQNPETWRKANPALGITVTEDYLAQEARRAAEMPAYQNTFRRLHLNQWTQQATRWISMPLWMENAGGVAVNAEALKGRTCYGGLDLSAVSDLTAWVLVFPSVEDPEEIQVLCRFWCPESRLTDTKNQYRDQYQAWARDGFLTATPGDAVDQDFVKAQVLEDARRFHVVDFGVDRWEAEQLMVKFEAEGLKDRVAAVGLGFASMAAPMKELERRLLARKVRHGNHPVLRWNADNVAVRQDPAGNLKPDKASSQGKIDGIVALLIALDRAMRHATGSVYDRRGILVV